MDTVYFFLPTSVSAIRFIHAGPSQSVTFAVSREFPHHFCFAMGAGARESWWCVDLQGTSRHVPPARHVPLAMAAPEMRCGWSVPDPPAYLAPQMGNPGSRRDGVSEVVEFSRLAIGGGGDI